QATEAGSPDLWVSWEERVLRTMLRHRTRHLGHGLRHGGHRGRAARGPVPRSCRPRAARLEGGVRLAQARLGVLRRRAHVGDDDPWLPRELHGGAGLAAIAPRPWRDASTICRPPPRPEGPSAQFVRTFR